MEQENPQKNPAKGENSGNLSVKERREQVLDQIFGTGRKEYMGNIWGWRFSLIGGAFILFSGLFAIYGTYKGWIRWDDQQERNGLFSSPSSAGAAKPKLNQPDSSQTGQ